MKKMKRIILAALLTLCLLGGCAQRQEAPEAQAPVQAEPEAQTNMAEPKKQSELPKETRVGFFLDTVITLTAYTDKPELLEQGLELCGEYEKMLTCLYGEWRIPVYNSQYHEMYLYDAEVPYTEKLKLDYDE